MWCSEEENAVGGDVYRPRPLCVGVRGGFGMDQASLDYETAERMANEDDGPLESLLQLH